MAEPLRRIMLMHNLESLSIWINDTIHCHILYHPPCHGMVFIILTESGLYALNFSGLASSFIMNKTYSGGSSHYSVAYDRN